MSCQINIKKIVKLVKVEPINRYERYGASNSVLCAKKVNITPQVQTNKINNF